MTSDVMSDRKEKIKALAKLYYSDTVAVRRHIHANPELSFEEYNTSRFIASKLEEYNIPYTKMVNTGIVALIEGNEPSSRTIALRADMDALPISEQNKTEYCSRIPGVMHACGHDVHSAALLGAARILSELRSDLKGTVKLIFQPGEEKLPGGASLMIKEGVLEDPRPQSIIAQHVYPPIEAGKVGFRSGMYMASTDELYVTVRGIGGHAAVPSQYINPLLIASAIMLELQKKFMNKETREIPGIPTVLAFGKIIGSGATNVIPEYVSLEGTFRTMDERWRAEAHDKMRSIAERIASQMGGSCEFRIEKGYPFLVNDELATARTRQAAEEYLGKENVEDLDLRMAAEDFAWYSQQVPGCFFRLGTGNRSKGITSGVHTPTFDIDERALEVGSGLMAWIAMRG